MALLALSAILNRKEVTNTQGRTEDGHESLYGKNTSKNYSNLAGVEHILVLV